MDSIDWLDTQGTAEAHAARDELTSLRAFNQACEEQEAAGYAYADDIRGFRDRGLSVTTLYLLNAPDGRTPLYVHPDPAAAQLRVQNEELLRMLTEQDYEYNRKTNALITRHAKQLTTRDQQVAEACAKAAEAETKVARECLAAFGDNAVSHCQVAFVIRSGEWKKHMNGNSND